MLTPWSSTFKRDATIAESPQGPRGWRDAHSAVDDRLHDLAGDASNTRAAGERLFNRPPQTTQANGNVGEDEPSAEPWTALRRIDKLFDCDAWGKQDLRAKYAFLWPCPDPLRLAPKRFASDTRLSCDSMEE